MLTYWKVFVDLDDLEQQQCAVVTSWCSTVFKSAKLWTDGGSWGPSLKAPKYGALRQAGPVTGLFQNEA